MITYLLNFVLCSGLLLLVYKLFLQSESLYRFNRFYLLSSLVFAMIVPMITIKVLPREAAFVASQTSIQPVAVVDNEFVHQPINEPIPRQNPAQLVPAGSTVTPQQNNEPTIFTYQNIKLGLFALYLLGAIGLQIRFIKNLYQINRTIALNPGIGKDGTNLVLIDGDITPHSFLQYIFLNKKDYEAGVIEPEIICHEQTHVRQHHSLDVIFVELVQIVCWFNPFIPLFRKAIQLNHEFLADETVILNYENTPAYQHLLLAKVSQANSLYLTSQFNYLTPKKRLIMMTKTTSTKIALLKQLALAPVFVVAVLLFSHKVIAQSKPTIEKPINDTASARKNDFFTLDPVANFKVIPPAKQDAKGKVLRAYASILTQYKLLPIPPNTKRFVLYEVVKLPKEVRLHLQDLYDQMSKQQREEQIIQFGPLLLPAHQTKPTAKDFALWTRDTKCQMWIDGKKINNAELAKHSPSEFAHFGYQGIRTIKDYRKNKSNIYLMTPAYFKMDRKQTKEDHYQLPGLNANYRQDFDAKRVAAAIGFIGFASKTVSASKTDAPQSVLDEYTAILTKNNLPYKEDEQVNVSPPFPPADRERLETLYKQMSRDQQANQYVRFMQPFPPPAKCYPTDQQLTTWQDAVKYGVWLDGKRIKNSELAKYKAADFDYMSFSRLMPIAVKNDKFNYQVELMTKPYYAKYRDQILKKKDLLIYIPKDKWKMRPAGAVEKNGEEFVTAKKEDSIKVTTIKYDATGGAILFAKNDAPQYVIDQYRALLKKFRLPCQKGSTINLKPNFTAADREQLKALYLQMSRKQQLEQYVWVRPKDPMPYRTKHNPPTQQQLMAWQHTTVPNYLIIINNHWLKNNSELSKYKLSDFYSASVSVGHMLGLYNGGHPRTIKGTFYNIRLETNGFFEESLKEISAKQEWSIDQFSKEREELVMANW